MILFHSQLSFISYSSWVFKCSHVILMSAPKYLPETLPHTLLQRFS